MTRAFVGFQPAQTGVSSTTDLSGLVRGENVLNACAAEYGMDPGASAAANTTAFEECRDALVALGGGTMLINAGTYQVNTLDMVEGVVVVGAGVDVTILDGNSALAPVLNYEGTWNALSGSTHVKNAGHFRLSITGTATSIGVNCEHASSLHMGDFRVDNVAYGIRGYGWWDSVLSGDVRVQECSIGIWLGSHNNDGGVGGVVDTNNIRFAGATTIESCFQSDIVITGKGVDGLGNGSQKPNNIWFNDLKVESSFVQDARRIILESVNGVYFDNTLLAWTNFDSGYSTPVDGVYATGESLHVVFRSPNCTNISTNVLDSWFYANGTDYFTLADPSFLLGTAPATAHLRFGGTNRRVDYDLDGVKLGPSFTPAALTVSGTPTSVRQTHVRADGTVAMTADLILADSSPAASEAYVNNAAAGQSWKDACACATTDALSGSWTYDNGTSGVGATLTRTTNGALGTSDTDGYTVSANDRIIVKNQANEAHNGIYVVTTVGSGGAATVLTRATDMDSSAEIAGATAIALNGTANENAQFTCATPASPSPTVGTTDITWVTSSAGTPALGGDLSGTVSNATVAKIGTTPVTGDGTSITVTGKLTQTGTPSATGDLATKGYVDDQVSPTNTYKRFADYENGDDANDGLTPASAKKTLRAAVISLPNPTASHRVGTVYCAPCQFVEPVLPIPITRNIAILGAPSAGGQGITSAYDNYGTTIKAGNGTNADIFDTGNYEDGSDYTDWSHRVVLRDLMIDGNRANNPGGGYGIAFRQPGFQQDLNNVTVKECNKAGIFVKERGVNFHSRNVGITHCGTQHPGVSLASGVFTFPESAVHGAVVGDVIVFHGGSWSGGSGPTEWLPYYVHTVVSSTQIQIASVKDGSALAFTSVTGTATALWPGGMRIEIEDGANGCLYTLRDYQCDDNGYSNFHIDVAAVGSKNMKVSIDGLKVENKVGTVTRLSAAEGSGDYDLNVYIKGDTSTNVFSCYSNEGATNLTNLPSNFANGAVVVLHESTLTGVNPWTRYYVVNKQPQTFQLALTRGGSAIDLTGTSAVVKVQFMGGSARCHVDPITVDQRDAAHGITLAVRDFVWQTDSGIRTAATWTGRNHSIVRLIAGGAEAIGTQTVVDLNDVNCAFSGAYMVDDFDRNGVRIGDPFTWTKLWYHGVPTGAVPLSMLIGQVGIITGTGSPASVVSARPGTIYLRSDGGSGTSLYIKESGTDATGWVRVTGTTAA